MRIHGCNVFFQPEKFVNLGIEPPKGVLLFGPPGTGKTLCARAVANRTDACFIRVIGSELVQKYVGEVNALAIFLIRAI
jgi:26S proteasome regulatory subunit T1